MSSTYQESSSAEVGGILKSFFLSIKCTAFHSCYSVIGRHRFNVDIVTSDVQVLTHLLVPLRVSFQERKIFFSRIEDTQKKVPFTKKAFS